MCFHSMMTSELFSFLSFSRDDALMASIDHDKEKKGENSLQDVIIHWRSNKRKKKTDRPINWLKEEKLISWTVMSCFLSFDRQSFL